MGKVGIIGLGNMGQAIAKGIVNKFGSDNLLVSSPHLDKNHPFVSQHSVKFSTDNEMVFNEADIVILAVKPDVLRSLLNSTKAKSKLIVSVAAGVRQEEIEKSLGCKVIRAMPNTPCLISQGVTGLYGEHNKTVEGIFAALGSTFWVDDERLLDIVTAVGGSGPAFMFHYLQCLIKAATELGLDEQSATKLVLGTNSGALALANESPDLEQLKKQVTSKGGTTAAGLSVLEPNLGKLISQTIEAAYDRAQELGA